MTTADKTNKPTSDTSKREQARAEFPDSWIAVAPGDVLDGVVTDVDLGWSDARTNGGTQPERGWYPLLTVLQDDGRELKWHAFETVAESEILKRQPKPGERVTVCYTGESENVQKGRNAAKLFTLRVHGRDPAQVAASVYDRLTARGAGGRMLPPASASVPPSPAVPDDSGADHPF